MSRGTELAKNTTILLLGRISTRAINFFLLPLYTAYLSEVQYGVVDLVSTLIAMLCPIVGLQLENAIFRFMIPERGSHLGLQRIISSALITQLALLVVYALLFMCISPWIHNEYKWFLLSNVIIASCMLFLVQILRGFGRNTDYALASFISSVGVIVLNIWFIVGLGWGAYGMLSAIIGGNLLAILYTIFRIKLWRYISVKDFDKACLKEMLAFSVPLIPNELSWWAIRASDRVIISAFIGLAATGVISVGHKFPEIFMTIYSVFGLAWTESVVMHIKEKDGVQYFSRMTDTMFKIFSSVSLVIIAFIPLIFSLMVNSKFDDSYNLIPLYFIGANVNIVIGLISVIYIAKHETKSIAKTSLFGATISILTCILLVKIIGVYASPVSFIVGFGAMMIYRCIDMRRFARIEWDFRYLWQLFISFFIVCICYYQHKSSFSIVGIVLSLIFLLWHNRRNVSAIYVILKNKLKH